MTQRNLYSFFAREKIILCHSINTNIYHKFESAVLAGDEADIMKTLWNVVYFNKQSLIKESLFIGICNLGLIKGAIYRRVEWYKLKILEQKNLPLKQVNGKNEKCVLQSPLKIF